MAVSWVTAVGGLVIAYLLLQIYKAIREALAPPPPPAKWMVGELTPRSLALHDGRDWSKPTCIAVRGVIYDVTKAADTYGPGKRLAVYAGREVARALALDSLDAKDCCDDLAGCSPEQLARLDAAAADIKATYDEVGTVVPMKELTLQQLARHDGSDPSLPMLLAIRGVVYDVSSGKQFYGPNGIYPFAGHEVARAFALTSTELSDCTDNLDGLGAMELDNLREWEEKFNFKYPVVGTIV